MANDQSMHVFHNGLQQECTGHELLVFQELHISKTC